MGMRGERHLQDAKGKDYGTAWCLRDMTETCTVGKSSSSFVSIFIKTLEFILSSKLEAQMRKLTSRNCWKYKKWSR